MEETLKCSEMEKQGQKIAGWHPPPCLRAIIGEGCLWSMYVPPNSWCCRVNMLLHVVANAQWSWASHAMEGHRVAWRRMAWHGMALRGLIV